ncbi:hypothetical protein I302_101510 [Kwoniella bestiolae CBS 10118]|uniref:Heme oxygenase 2 n=1 Tax=Kwoniella bestiolae CBS 10118 TaxID=1296100 RepID=A0A1B9GCG0_9TREE|nr:heme oxygenase 2 [Kwoniella bestiolae CBS 10118]OCF28705.1 heme oxygenase 2 [Kwoniella bestiolae CBS 10118]
MLPPCPFANLSIIQPPTSTSKLHLNLSSSSSSPPDTPSFSPNTPSEKPSEAFSARGKLPGEHELELSQPVSTLLKLGTQRAHVKAEHSAGAAALVQGGLGLEEYVRWLAVLWRIYDALELGLAENSTNPVLAPTYDPALLARAPALAEDISYLLTLIPSSSSTTTQNPTYSSNATSLPPFPLPPFLQELFTSPPEPLSNYINHIKSLASSSSSSSKLLAHSYVRYLGDLSGGQFIGARVKKSYDLRGEEGTKFYYFEFQNRSNGADGDDESKFHAKKRLGEVKDWFRRGMDEGVGEDQVLKANLVEEANIAFSLNTDLFSVIRLPSSSTSQPQMATQQKQAKDETTMADKLNSIVWFLVAAGAGVLLNIYVQPVVTDWVSSKRNGI